MPLTREVRRSRVPQYVRTGPRPSVGSAAASVDTPWTPQNAIDTTVGRFERTALDRVVANGAGRRSSDGESAVRDLERQHAARVNHGGGAGDITTLV